MSTPGFVAALRLLHTHQNVRPAWPTLLKARASVETAAPMALHKLALKDAAVPMTCGNDVAEGVGAANTTPAEMATPCSASFHLRCSGGAWLSSAPCAWRDAAAAPARVARRRSCSGHAPLVGRNEQARHAQRGVCQQPQLLRRRQPHQQVCAAAREAGCCMGRHLCRAPRAPCGCAPATRTSVGSSGMQYASTRCDLACARVADRRRRVSRIPKPHNPTSRKAPSPGARSAPRRAPRGARARRVAARALAQRGARLARKQEGCVVALRHVASAPRQRIQLGHDDAQHDQRGRARHAEVHGAPADVPRLRRALRALRQRLRRPLHLGGARRLDGARAPRTECDRTGARPLLDG